MAIKRRAEELEATAPPLRRQPSKRTKLSPSADARSNSSEPSSCSVSEDSALQSSPPASAHARDSSMSSVQPGDDESDATSSISSDSDSDISDSDGEEVVALGGPKKPQIFHPSSGDGMHDLKARIADLLPQLKAANSMLESGEGQHSIEDVEDGEQHIEMNLGLGVLEQQEDGSSSESSDDESNDEDDNDDLDLPVSSGAVHESANGKEKRVMEALTGHRKDPRRAGIQELG